MCRGMRARRRSNTEGPHQFTQNHYRERNHDELGNRLIMEDDSGIVSRQTISEG